MLQVRSTDTEDNNVKATDSSLLSASSAASFSGSASTRVQTSYETQTRLLPAPRFWPLAPRHRTCCFLAFLGASPRPKSCPRPRTDLWGWGWGGLGHLKVRGSAPPSRLRHPTGAQLRGNRDAGRDGNRQLKIKHGKPHADLKPPSCAPTASTAPERKPTLEAGAGGLARPFADPFRDPHGFATLLSPRLRQETPRGVCGVATTCGWHPPAAPAPAPPPPPLTSHAQQRHGGGPPPAAAPQLRPRQPPPALLMPPRSRRSAGRRGGGGEGGRRGGETREERRRSRSTEPR